MDLTLDATAGPLHEQIATAIRRAVAIGELATGARLPTAREIADRHDVNINTVLRAYRQLSAEKLIELRRGRGATVIGHADLAHLHELIDDVLDEAGRLGVSRGELVRLLMERS